MEDLTGLSHEGKRTTGFNAARRAQVLRARGPRRRRARGVQRLQEVRARAVRQRTTPSARRAVHVAGEGGRGFGKRTLAPGRRSPSRPRGWSSNASPVPRSPEGGTKAFGRDVNELLNRAASQDLAPHERATLESLTDSIKQIYHTGERSPGAALRWARQSERRCCRCRGVNQFEQTAWNVAKPGLQDFTRGLVRYARDPEFRALIQASGGRGSSYEHLFNQIRGDTGFGEDVLQLAKERLPERMQPWTGPADEQGPASRRSDGWRRRPRACSPRTQWAGAIGWAKACSAVPLGAGHYVHNEGLIQQALDAGGHRGGGCRADSRAKLREAASTRPSC